MDRRPFDQPRRGQRVALALALVIGLVPALVAAVSAADPEPTDFSGVAWTTRAPAPFSTAEAQGEVVGGKLYVFGGFDSQKGCCTPTARVHVFDPVANAWAARAAMPAANGTQFGGVTHAGTATNGTDIFIAGGYTSDGSGAQQTFGTRETWRYDVAANTYTRLPDLPVALASAQLEFVGGKLHLFGGTNAARTTDLTTHYVLDLAGSGTSWTTAAALPNGRHHMGSAVVGGKIYAVGGQRGHDGALITQSSVHVYDPATGAWTAKASLPSARGHISGSTIAFGGRVVVLGGETAHGSGIADAVAYDPATDRWSTLSALPASRVSGVAGAAGGKLLFTTGYAAGFSYSATTWSGTPDQPGLCAPVSDLACSAVPVSLPHRLSFDAAGPGLADGLGRGTGLTMVQPSSAGGDYRPERLAMDTTAGELVVRSTAGTQFRTPSTTTNGNALDNGLGVGFDGSRKVRVETTLVNPPAGTGSEQGGLWFGPDEDNYVKLVVIGTTATSQRVQLMRETAGTYAPATDELNSDSVDMRASNVRLSLVLDPGAGTATATYRVGDGAVQSLGQLALPREFTDGSRVPANARTAGASAFAGIFATHRWNTSVTSLDYRFASFSVEDADPPATGGSVEIGPQRIVTEDIAGGIAGDPKTITIRNTGTSSLQLQPVALAGAGAGQWSIGQQPATSVPAGGSTTARVSFNPTSIGLKVAALQVRTSDPGAPLLEVPLRGLGTRGEGGDNEPSLQWVLDAHEVPVQTADDDPATTTISSTRPTAGLLGEEIPAQTFRKAGSGPISIEPLGIFGLGTTDPLLRLSWYQPATPASRNEVMAISNVPASNAQTLEVPGGLRTFDPGTAEFGFVTTWPPFGNRLVYQEDRLNTFSGSIPHHVRIYPYKLASGAVVPNAYVVATEEFTSGYDYNDLVFVVRNVRPAVQESGAEIKLDNLDGAPFDDRLAFNRLQAKDPRYPNQGMHDEATVRIRNTGSDPLRVSSLQVSGPWQLIATPTLPSTIAAGSYLDVGVRFTAQTIGPAGGLYEGSLTIGSNDTDEPSSVVQLGGFWQSQSEGDQEPDLPELGKVFGYGTAFTSPGQQINNGGRLIKAGDEVHSAYWRRANTTQPVDMRQLAAFHSQGNIAALRLYDKASPSTRDDAFMHWSNDGQTLFPRAEQLVNNQRVPSQKSLTPRWSLFGFDVDGEKSDWKLNYQDYACVQEARYQCGHHMRFWPVKDRAGRLVPNTYLMGMDYAGINYDFNDNLYLISNIAPENAADDPSVCRPVACSEVAVDTPYELPFSAAVAGTVADKDGQGTGFKWVDQPVGGDGHQAARVDLDAPSGVLRVTTASGSAFGSANNQENALGAGLKWGSGSAPKAISTVVRSVPAGTGKFEQGGLWFGRNQDNYAKLVVLSTPEGQRVQLLKEQDGLAGAGSDITTAPQALAGKSVELQLVADPAGRSVTASFTVDGGARQSVGELSVPGSWFNEDPEVVDTRIGTASFAGILASHRTGTTLTYVFDDFNVRATSVTPRPSVTGVRPADGAVGVVRDTSVATDLRLPSGGIDNATLDASTVRLVRDSDGAAVAVTRGTSGGGDTVVVTPTAPLAANTKYRFEITASLKDVSGASFVPFTSRFTTGTGLSDSGTGSSTAAFDKVPLPTASGAYQYYSALAIGPDGRLYAGMADGRIRRFPIAADGSLGTPTTITSLVPSFNAADDATKRLLIGMAFDPSSTADAPVLWTSHSTYGFENMADWGGKVTRLSGTGLQTAQDYITGLPRSSRDHVTNGVSFGQDGKLYVLQGSNSAMGAADATWSDRPERALSAAMLRVDPARITAPPLNVKTADGGTYDPTATTAPVTVYASGIRNAFDMIWHSSGRLFVPTNGSAAGGNVPSTPSPLPASCSKRLDSGAGAYTGPSVKGVTGVGTTQHDYLFNVVSGGYYGHPNPARCEWVLNGGNPTSGIDKAEVSQYPVGTLPDRNWRGVAHDFGLNKSPNGGTEYTNGAFGGSLRGKLLVARYSESDDIIALTPGGDGNIAATQSQIPGLTGFKDPIDLVEDPTTGNLYVSEYDQFGTDQKITLLKPRTSGGGGSPTDCAPYSALSCDAVDRPLPIERTWDADEGAINDKDGTGTGFTMSQPSSNGGALRPSLIDASSGELTLTSTAGVQFKTASTTTNGNTLDNGLGVGVDTTAPYVLETTLRRPPLGIGASEQSGLWLGPDEDNYLKLVVVSFGSSTGPKHTVQLLSERGGAITDERNELSSPDLSAADVRLVLEVNPAQGTVTASYRVDGGAAKPVGTITGVPASVFDGSTLSSAVRAAGVKTFAGIFATHRANGTATGLPFRFADFSVRGQGATEPPPPANRPPVVAAVADRRDTAGAAVTVPMSASDPDSGQTLRWTAENLPPGLTISSTTGTISGTLAASAARATPYAVKVTATDDGTPAQSGSASFAWTVDSAPPPTGFTPLKVNFQSPAAAVPADHVRDYGQPYGARTGTAQGSGRTYGWIDPVARTPLDLSTGGWVPGNGRDRDVITNQRNDTIMHMQADDVSGTFSGVPREGAWELAVPNGAYQVTVGVGDPSVWGDAERHTVNVEGVSVIKDFVPSTTWGSAGRHTARTITRVSVSDGRLTLDALGGFNTKINFVEVATSTSATSTVQTASTATARSASTLRLEDWGPEVAEPLRVDLGGSGTIAGTRAWSACPTATRCWPVRVAGGEAAPVLGAAASRRAASPGVPAKVLSTSWTGRRRAGGRGGVLALDVAVAPGEYRIRLHTAAGGSGPRGRQVVDVNVEGGRRELRRAIAPRRGRRAVTTTLKATVRDGRLNLSLSAASGVPTLSAFELVPIGARSK